LSNSTLNTPILISSNPSLPFAEVSKNLYFQKIIIEYSSFETNLKEERFEILSSLDTVKWYSLENIDKFPTLGFATPPPVKTYSTKEKKTSSALQTLPSSSKTQPSAVKIEISPSYIPFSPKLHTFKSPSPPCSPRVKNPMAGANPPANRMDAIVATRYAPLVLPQPVKALPLGDYLKYMPKFMGEEDITAEQHLVSFYDYEDNQNIENENVWMRVFIQSLFGEARKWFRGLAPGSIISIKALDADLLKHWGHKKYFLYYITNLDP
jgi:hypothetical protein